MKTYTIFLLAILTVSQTFGQSAEFAQREASKSFELDVEADFQDEPIYVLIENNTFDELNLTWTRTERLLPSGWESAICDNIRCWLPNISSRPFTIASRDTFSFIIHLYPNRAAGDSAIIDLVVTNDDDPTDMTELTVTFKNEKLTSTDEVNVDPSLIQFNPNPAFDHTTLQDESLRVQQAQIYSISGARLDVQQVQHKTQIQTGNLNAGNYIVRLYDKEGRLITSKRLQKN